MTGKIDNEGDSGEMVAICALASVPGMGAASMLRLLKAYGSYSRVLEDGPRELASCAGLNPRARRFLEQRPDLEKLGRWALEKAREAGARAVTAADPAYPALLRRIENPPPVLYVRGALASEARRVALVGARAADEAASRLARELAEDLACAGVEVVSGGARGVDAAAHAGALWGGGSTVAVLGTGIDVSYPPENGALFDRIAAGGGALVSELPPGAPSSRHNFPRRNRTIAGLSDATVVVRASATSGALITARHAIDMGRPVFAVPGAPHDPLAAGPQRLLAAGAAAVSSAADVLELLGWPVLERLTARQAERSTIEVAGVLVPAVPEPALEGPARRVLELLDAGRAVHVDVLAARAELPSFEALRCLAELELLGLIHQKPGKYFLRRPACVVNRNGSAGI